MPQCTLSFENVVEGDRKDISIGVQKDEFDFTGVTVEAKLRSPLPNSAIVHTFVPVVVFPDPLDLSTFTIGLTLTGVETAALGLGIYYGDLVISAPAFGPYTPIQYSFRITDRITQ